MITYANINYMNKIIPTVLSALLISSAQSYALTSLLLGDEYQAQNGTNAGTIRTGDPAGDAQFDAWLNTSQLVAADILVGDDCATATDGIYATWGRFSSDGQTSLDLGGTTANVSLSGWNEATSTFQSDPSASLAWSYNNGTALQSGSERPGFASGAGTGYGVRTDGSSADGVRNGVRFDFTNAISAFGIFGGDLETGGPNGSPEGFLYLHFTDGSDEFINYVPDLSLLPDASFSGTGNNLSETYGNETGRFIGISDDARLIDYAIFVVGDDDDNDDGDSEHLSFIAPITFTEVTGGTCVNHIPDNVPEPSTGLLGMLLFSIATLRRKRS